jgi:hypothetical protein
MKKTTASYKIDMDGDWSLEDLYEFPHTYIHVYSFLYSFLRPIENFDDEDDRLVITYSIHPWRGGYSSVNFYNNLKYIVSPNHRPKIKSIQYASPGWIELTVIVGISLNIKKIVLSFTESANALNELYNNIYRGMHDRKMMGIEAKRQTLLLSKEQTDFAIESANNLSMLLGFENVGQIQKLTKNPLATLKILLSFYRKIKILSEFTAKGKAKF